MKKSISKSTRSGTASPQEDGPSNTQNPASTTPARPNTLQRSDTITVKKSSMWDLMWREFLRKRRFETAEVESLYQRYVLQANVNHLTNLLGLLFATTFVLTSGLLYMIVNDEDRPESSTQALGRIDRNVAVVANILCSIVYMGALCVIYWRAVSEKGLVYISYILVATFLIAEISLSRNSPHIWYTVVFIYITYALLPIRLLDATLSGIMLSFVQLPSDVLYGDAPVAEYFRNYKSIISNTLILTGMNIMGILTHFPGEMAKRKAFNEIRQLKRARLKIMTETKRQQRLMLSVLPKHLVEEMREDMAKANTNARKLYLMTYEPASIVFADICGFTAMADKSKAEDVVKLLNDLYCSFDKLAELHRCLRIKLLGDCYYCVSGMPRGTAQHADQAVHMGMDMIAAIKEVRDRFKANVDVRVGIHSGVVQCGVLGLKKWQFDVWSSDVTLANYMESGGIPGHSFMYMSRFTLFTRKVHISMATKNYLTYEYNLEPGNGASREPALRGIETFFVISRKLTEEEIEIKKFMERGRQSRQSRVTVLESTITGSFGKRSKTIDNRTNSMFATSRVVDVEKEVNRSLFSSINSRSIRKLKNENCSRMLLFRDRNVERKYNKEPDRTLQSYFVTAFIIFFVIGLVQYLKLPKADLFFTTFSLGLIWVFSIMTLVLARKYHTFPRLLRRISEHINRNRRIAQALAIATIIVCYLATFIPMVILFKTECAQEVNSNSDSFVTITHYFIQVWSEDICQNNFLEYTLLYTILVMVIMGAFQIIVFYQKIIVMFLFCAFYCITITKANPYQSKREASILLFFMVTLLVTFVLLLLIHSQQTEIIQRLDFVWKLQARREKDDVARMQENNQRLIENILPAHVARRYLEKDVRNDDLYSEQKGSVCMLFACITNFSFAENGNINILHDFISDFDEILSHEYFRALEKIKSTGPVYMAASGLSESTCDISAMEHVVKMADFALRMRDQMKDLNQRHASSYNIKIGMSVGPVVAGVIGASMPQFDLWGNTVNVASRMYSTGSEGEIQVTEDVAKVLQTTNRYNLKERGTVYVKGKGNMFTYWLKGLKEAEDPYCTENFI